ncbi:MAG: hypothetical protein [Bacteriophage sp.]|nr:MAG: hypothetical protein [Bacteriophage sp.]
MGAIGLNPIRLDRIGLDPIRINAIKLGVPGASGTERPYIDPEVLASLKAVCICYGKSNDDPDRAVVKNLVDPDNPFVISNAAYDKMSSYGGYEFAKFTTWNINASSTQIINISDYSITFKKLIIDEFKQPYCEILGVLNKELVLKCKSNKRLFLGWQLKYKTEEGGPDITLQIPLDSSDVIANNEMEFILPYKTKEELATLGAIESSVYYLVYFSNRYLAVGEEYTVEMLPLFEGAFVTDGIDDLITSTKTVQEMLGGSNELTIVSMVHQVKDSANNVSFTNYIRGSANGYFRNIVNNYDKTGIYGYTSSDLKGLSVVNNILGDKNDYTSNGDNRDSIINGNFSVQGYSYNDGNNTGDFSSVAWYWTIIANKVLTTDQINQVIAYFNLDRTLKPDILCDVKKQGITNENHAEFGDKLIDFSGNGRDIQLNNIAWDGDSGIGKYNYPNWKVNVTQGNKYARIVYYDSINGTYSADFKGITDLYKSYGLSVEIRVNRANTIDYHSIKEDGIYTVTPPDDTTSIDIRFGGENVYNASCDITITQIPSNAGALCLDGVNDFGKVTGMPVYKDYTFIADRYINNNVGSVASKSVDSNQYGAFIFEIGRGNYSFNVNSTVATNLNKDRTISYLSKYSYNGENVNVGNEEDSNSLWIGTIRDNDTRFSNMAIYSLMSFPYSMSEFLIERQLKKHKLGTLYPDMVEFRPIVKSNLPYSSISYSVNPGEYISVDSMVTITVTLPNTSDKLMEVSCNAISDISISGDNGVYEITGKIVKSPQKINLVISSYLTMLNNETLISNETLIKNE